VKGLVERLFREAGVRGQSLDRGTDDNRFHTTRSATISINKKPIGVIGEVSRATAEAFGLEARVALVDLDFEALLPHLSIQKQYIPTPEFPAVKRDLAFVLDNSVEYHTVELAIYDIDPMLCRVELFDVYSGKGVEDGKKSLAVHLEFRADNRTLKSEEVDQVMEKVIGMLKKNFFACVRQ
ncbi:MAG: hypothetical protein ABIH67_02610, partial [Candidatus Uhrbacteria bacterium]